MLPNIQTKTLYLISVFSLLISLQLQGKTMQLNSSDPIEESWRWNEIEYLRDLNVSCGTEDSSGNLWFATSENVIYYDGYEVELISIPLKFHAEEVIDIHVSKDNQIILFMTNGLLSFIQGQWIELDRFNLPFLHPREVIQETSSSHIYVVTPKGLFEVEGNQITRCHKELNRPDLFLGISTDALWLKHFDDIVSIKLLDGEISPDDACIRYDISSLTQEFEWNGVIANPQGDVTITSSSQARNPHVLNKELQIFEQSNLIDLLGNQSAASALYIGENQETLLLYGKSFMSTNRDGKWKTIDAGPWVPTNRPFIFRRHNGNLVIGGKQERVYEIDYSESRWQSYDGVNFQCTGEDQSQWFITYEGKILQRTEGNLNWTQHTENVIDTPLTMLCSTNGTIWAAGANEGVAAVSYFNGVRWQMDLHPDLMSTISHLSAIELTDGKVYFGSGHEPYADRGGVVRYRPTSNGWSFDYLNGSSIPSRVVGLVEHKNEFWFGGIEITKFSEDSGTKPVEIPGINYEWTDKLISDEQGNVWVATWGNGLHIWNGENWTQATAPTQLGSEHVVDMVFDPTSKDIWIATNQSISKYSPPNDVWVPNAINRSFGIHREGGTLKIDKKGNLWINKAFRPWYFRTRYPFKFSEDKKGDFKTFRYTPDTNSPILNVLQQNQNILETSNASISWEGRDFLSVTKKAELKYAFNVDNGAWSVFSSKTELILKNLHPGKHEVQVICRDQDGNLSDPAIATIVVSPVIWTKKSIVLLIAVLVLLLLALVILVIWLKVQNLIQLERFKVQFFTNISHDLRTPLTAIKGPIEELLATSTPDTEENLRLAHRNSEKMLKLVDQLLEFRKHTQGRGNEGHLIQGNVISRVKEIINLSQTLTIEKSLSLIVTADDDTQRLWFDSEKLERVIDNLLSNAIKYTPKNGEIRITTYVRTKSDIPTLHFIIENDGPGISKSEQKHVFEPFYRGDISRHSATTGTGLGLSSVKLLLDSMNGKISVQSPTKGKERSGPGTRFSVEIVLETTNAEKEQPLHTPVSTQRETIDSSPEKGLHSILLIDDEEDIRQYLSTALKDSFHVVQAEDAEEGYRIAKTQNPDFILMDVMMPDQDGFQLCKKLKKTPQTSHLPVFFLSALKGEEHELKGLECGAEDFLSKPINLKVLKQKLGNHLRARNDLQKAVIKQKETISSPREMGNELFMERVTTLVMEHLDSPDLDTEELAHKLNMSRITLYRKFKSISNTNPSTFIKELRMKKAADLLLSKEFTVGEIADKVGFQSSSYLSATFKATYGCTPKQYQNKQG